METRICQNCKKNFTVKPDDFSFYEKLKVPSPSWCPHCRFIRRLTFINHRSLYKRTCENCHNNTISMYHPNTPIIVWCVKCYISDTWDARDYAQEYNFSKTFFKQYKELKQSIPHRALDQNEKNGTGCEYSNLCYTSKNIYLSFDVGGSEDIKYSSYVFKNKQLTKKEYKNAVATLQLETYSGQQKTGKEFIEMAQKAIHKYAHIKNSVKTVGDFIENSKNIYHSYGLVDAENAKYIFIGANTIRDSRDLVSVGRLEECYEAILAGRGGSRVIFSFSCGGGSKNIFYCDSCRGCSDCFGCVGLSKKQYYIFNKQYSKEEYFKLIEKIKKHMDDIPYIDKIGRKYPFGECFPTELSPFAYNETIAFEEHPLLKNEIIASGYRWKDMETKSYIPTIKINALPDSIDDVADTIIDEIIECPNQGKLETQCTSAYRILPDELSFYRQMNLPIPRFCPNCRYHARLVWKNPFNFYERECMCELNNHNHQTKCLNTFETMYAPDRP